MRIFGFNSNALILLLGLVSLAGCGSFEGAGSGSASSDSEGLATTPPPTTPTTLPPTPPPPMPPPPPTGGGAGIAAQYPGDVGIDAHPDVVWFEPFNGTAGQVQSRYESVRNASRQALVNDPSPNSTGTSIRLRVTGGTGDATDLYRRLPASLDVVHIRFYVKPTAGSSYHHTGVATGGYNPATSYPQGGAGTRPVGNERMTFTLETGRDSSSNGEQYIYNYWHEMDGNPGSNPNGGANGTNYWGNDFFADNRRPASNDGEWTCYEYRIQLNSTVSSYDGSFTVWRNGIEIFDLRAGYVGELVYGSWWEEGNPSPYSGFPTITHPGFNFRTDLNLDMNFLWIANYATSLANGENSDIQFDQIVVARSYIGPTAAQP